MNRELDRKLALWVGYSIRSEWDTGFQLYKTPHSEAEFEKNWYKAVVTEYFTSSLDACFKWLVPKAIKEFGELKTRWMLKDWINSISTDIEYSLPIASSLCLAIEKLIDAKGE